MNKKLIGEGTYGKVYDNGNDVIKVIKSKYIYKSLTEIDITSRIKHPNIIKSHKIEFKDNDLWIFLEKGQVLKKYIKSKSVSLHEKEKIAIGIIKGLDYLHNLGYSHCDLKPSNIVIIDSESKIIDFSLSCQHTVEYITYGTFHYKPPERLNDGEKYFGVSIFSSDVSDMWSLGCLIYYIFSEKDLFHSETESIFQDIEDFLKNQEDYLKNVPDMWKKIIISLIRIEPLERSTTNKIFKFLNITNENVIHEYTFFPIDNQLFFNHEYTIEKYLKKIYKIWKKNNLKIRSFTKGMELFYRHIDLVNIDIKNLIYCCFYISNRIFDNNYNLKIKNNETFRMIFKYIISTSFNYIGSDCLLDYYDDDLSIFLINILNPLNYKNSPIKKYTYKYSNSKF